MRLANLHISWMEHNTVVGYVFEKLQRRKQTPNCTLSAEEQEMSVHKDVLSACSDFFKDIFQEQRQILLVTLEGISFQDLVCVMEFMYTGKMVVTNNRLENVLSVAKHLQIKGLNPCGNVPLSASNEPFQQTPSSRKQLWNVNLGFSMRDGVRRLEFHVDCFGLKREIEDVDAIMHTNSSIRACEAREQSRPMCKTVDNVVITFPNASKHHKKAAKQPVLVCNANVKTIVIDASKSVSKVTERRARVFNAEDDDDDMIVRGDSSECGSDVARESGPEHNAEDDSTVEEASEHSNETTEQPRPFPGTDGDDDMLMLGELSKRGNEATEQSRLMSDTGDGSVTVGVALENGNEVTDLIPDAENGDVAVLSDFSDSDSDATVIYVPSDYLDCKNFSENVLANSKSPIVLDCPPTKFSSRVQNVTYSSWNSNAELPSYLNPRVIVHRIRIQKSLLHTELVPQAKENSSLHNGVSSKESDHNSSLEGQVCGSTEIASKQTNIRVNRTANVDSDSGDSDTAASSSDVMSVRKTRTKVGNSQGKFECLLCHKFFRCSDALEAHLLNHTGKGQKHSSPEGDDKEETVGGVSKKYKHTDNAKMLRCQKCNFHTDHVGSFERHKVMHSGEKPFRCSECEFATVWSYSLKLHKRTHSGNRPFKCPECKFASTSASGLRRHQMIHTGETPYKCTECDFASVQYDSLKRHRLTHTGETPYKCPECNFATAWRGNLKEHLRKHTGERPYKCDMCDYSTSRASNLRHHQVRHSDVRRYKCPDCEYCAKWKEQLGQHQACHSTEKRFNCSECSYGTSRRGDFQRHMHIRARINTQVS